jgi:hypothetical protein
MDHYITESYFNWLKSETFTIKSEQRAYEGVLRVLHDIPFTWIIHADDNRSGDAVTFRQFEFLDQIEIPYDTPPLPLGQWATAAPSVLEVLLGCARRWNYYFNGPCVSFYFNIMFRNMGFENFPGRALGPQAQDQIREKVDIWLTRQFQPNGYGSPWPLNNGFRPAADQRRVDIWSQMNAYSAEHFQ